MIGRSVSWSIVCMLLLVSGKVLGQGYAASFGVTAGYAEDGYGANVSFNHHIDRWSYVQFSLFGSSSKEDFELSRIPYRIVAFQPAYYKRVWLIDASKPIGVYVGGGGTIGYEDINSGSELLPGGAILQAESKFIYGGFLGVEVEYPVTEMFSFAVKFNQHYHVNSDIGKMFPYASAGIRVYLY